MPSQLPCRRRAAPAARRRPRAARGRSPARRATAGTARTPSCALCQRHHGSGPKPGALPKLPCPVRSASQGKKPRSMSPTSVNSRPVASRTAASMLRLETVRIDEPDDQQHADQGEGEDRTEAYGNPFEDTHAADIVARSAAAPRAEWRAADPISRNQRSQMSMSPDSVLARTRAAVFDRAQIEPHAGTVLADALDVARRGSPGCRR